MSIGNVLRKHLFYPLWTLKNGSTRLKFLKEFEQLQWLDRKELENIQFENLRKIIKHAYQNVSYYKQIFDDVKFDPLKFKDFSQIQQLPILTKDQIQTQTEQFIAKGYKKDSMIEYKTGGSTGKSLTVYGDLHRLDRGVASAFMCYRWAGWDIGQPMGRVWGNPPIPKTIKEKLINLLIEPAIWLDTINLNEYSVNEFVKEWEEVRPTLLHGHARSLFELANYLNGEKAHRIKPRGIISSSMMLLDSERTVIEDVFKVKVIDLYGCEEVGLIACECSKHEGMHINIFNQFIEFIKNDGSVAEPGSEGNIVITNLTNFGMPLIRYKIEDVGILSKYQCSCGRMMPLMQKITGRVADFLKKEDGSLVQGISLIERTLTKIKGLSQMQIIQENLTKFQINIVKNQLYNEDSCLMLISEFRKVFGVEIDVKIKILDRIKHERSGKYRFSICKIKNK